MRRGNHWGVSVGLLGGLVLLLLVAATVFWLAVIVAVVFVLAAVAYLARAAWMRLRR